jgi:hypothetical protein
MSPRDLADESSDAFTEQVSGLRSSMWSAIDADCRSVGQTGLGGTKMVKRP